MFIFPHGATVDGDGDLWVTDAEDAACSRRRVARY
jgi:hypothetical protein